MSWRAGGLAEKATTEAEALLVNVRRALRRAQAKAAELAAASITMRRPAAGEVGPAGP